MPSDLEVTPTFPSSVKVPDNDDAALADGFYADPSTGVWANANANAYLLKQATGRGPADAPVLNEDSGVMRIRSVSTVISLLDMSASDNNADDGDIALVRDNGSPYDIRGLYVYSKFSEAVGDGINNVVPSSGVGRWHTVWNHLRNTIYGIAGLDVNKRVMQVNTYLPKVTEIESGDTPIVVTGTSIADVPGMTVTVDAVAGRSVHIMCVPVEGATNVQFRIGSNGTATIGGSGAVQITMDDNTVLTHIPIGIDGDSSSNWLYHVPPASIMCIWVPSAPGSYTFKLRAQVLTSGMAISLRNVRLMAWQT